MAPKLYLDSISGPCRCVWMTCEALGLEVEIINIDLFKGEQNAEWFLKINPRHCVPVLDDDGFIMCESGAIMRYLAARYENDTLYPNDIKKRFIVDMTLDAVLGFISTAVRAFIYPKLFRKGGPDEEAINGVDKVLHYTNDHLLNISKFVAGDNMTIGDISLFTVLQSLLIGGFKFEDFSKYDKISHFVDHFKSLPYYEKCNTDFEEKVEIHFS